MRKRTNSYCALSLWTILGCLIGSLLFGSVPNASADDKGDAQALVDKSRLALSDMLRDNNFKWLKEYLKKSKGVLIFPQILKGGLILGGSGGSGVVMTRSSEAGTWSDPAFYTLGSVTFGLQIGGEASELVMLAMTQKAVDSLLTSSLKLGGDVSVAVGPIGAGAKGSLTVPEVTADFVSFSRTKGLYGGLNLEGSVLGVRDGLNSAYYGREVKPADILSKKSVSNSGAAELRTTLQKESAK